MINNLLNDLQLYQTKWSSDLVDTPKLSDMLTTKPEIISQVVSYVFGQKDNEFSTMLDMLTGKHFGLFQRILPGVIVILR